MRRWLVALVIIGLLVHALLSCGSPSPPPSSEAPRVVFTGDGPVTVVAGNDGRAFVVSETAGVTFEIVAAAEAGHTVGGATVEYHEGEDGFAHIWVQDASAALGRSLAIVKLSDLTGVSHSEIQKQAVITFTIVVTVVAFASVLSSVWKGQLATQEVNGILSSDLLSCDGQNPSARCLCKTPAEIAGLYHDLSVRSETTPAIGRTAFWWLTGNVAHGTVFGESLAIGPEAIGLVSDVAEMSSIGSFFFADGAAKLGLDEPYFAGMASDQPMKIVLLDYRDRPSSTPFGAGSTWSGVVLTGESCTPTFDDTGLSHSLSVTLDPATPNAHQDLSVVARLTPADASLPVTLTTVKTHSGDIFQQVMDFFDPFSLEDPWIVHGITDEDGVVRFHVPGSRVAPGDRYQYSVASAATGVARIGTYGMVAGTAHEVSPWAKLWAPNDIVNVGERVSFDAAAWLDAPGTFASDRQEVECVMRFGDGGSERRPQCTDFFGRASFEHTYTRPAQYVAELQVTGAVGGPTTVQKIVTVVDSSTAPVIDGFSHTPVPPVADQPTRFSWTVTDDHVGTSCWFDPDHAVAGDEYPIQDCVGRIEVNHTYPEAGQRKARLFVSNQALRSAEARLTVDVASGGPLPLPVISSFSALPGQATVGQSVVLRWTASADAGDTFTCVVDPDPGASGDEVTPPTCLGTQQITVTFTSPGSYSPTLTILGARGGSHRVSTEVTVAPAGAGGGPVAQLIANPPQTVVGGRVTLDASGSYDPSGGRIVRYEFSTGDGRSLTPSVGYWNTSYASVGEYTACVTVTNTAGELDRACELVRIVPLTSGSLPNLVIDNYWINGQRIDHWDIGTYFMTADQPLEIGVQWSNTGAPFASGDSFRTGFFLNEDLSRSRPHTAPLYHVGDASVRWGPGEIAPGTYALSIRLDYENSIRESNETDNTRSIRLTVEPPRNRPPMADFSFVVDGLTVAFTDRSTDPDGSGDLVGWTWTFGDGQTSGTRNPSYTYGAAGEYDVRLRVSDRAGASSSVTKRVTVTQPVDVTMSPPSATLETGASMLFEATVTGASDTSVTWSATCGSLSGSGNTRTFTAPGTAGSCSVVATSVADPSKSASASVTVTAAPAVSVSIAPTSVTLPVNGTQSFTATVTGSADTSVTWSATCGTLTGTGNTRTYTAPGSAGSCTVTATSVADPSNSATASVTVTTSGGDFDPAPSYISISNVSLGAASGGTRPVNFDISWDESWRGPYHPTWVESSDNWDAAWVFVKYRVSGGAWQHATLAGSGHVQPSGSVVSVSRDRVGAFVYRNGSGYGTFAANGVGLQWDYLADGVAAGALVEVQPFGIEMVYVPQGSFSLGSGGSSTGEFREGGTTTTPFVVSSQSSIALGDAAGQLYWTSSTYSGSPSGSTPASFPTGFGAFYVMKYQVTQGQYVNFLNTLTQVQADARKYTDSVYRYAITGSSVGSYATSLPYVAMNFANWADGAAFADWAGLRPMTELEFEKAARGPLGPVASEYAWSSTSITQATGLANAGTITETPTPAGTNAAYGFTSGVEGPVRVGSFAAPGRSRRDAGAGFFGALELSGNLWERPVTVGNAEGRAFTGTHGDGTLDVSGNANVFSWPGSTAVGAGFRGGSWVDSDAYLRVSHRSVAASSNARRGTGYGWRGARSAP